MNFFRWAVSKGKKEKKMRIFFFYFGRGQLFGWVHGGDIKKTKLRSLASIRHRGGVGLFFSSCSWHLDALMNLVFTTMSLSIFLPATLWWCPSPLYSSKEKANSFLASLKTPCLYTHTPIADSQLYKQLGWSAFFPSWWRLSFLFFFHAHWYNAPTFVDSEPKERRLGRLAPPGVNKSFPPATEK